MTTAELKDQPYEPTVDGFVEVLSLYLDPGDMRTFVELGARDCAETLAFARKLPNAHIYTFECNPATLPICERRISGHSNITLIRKAVSDAEGPISFFQFDGVPGASSIYRFHSSDSMYAWQESDQNEVRVEATTLGRFLEENRLSSIDALWMDIQGAELAALRGLGRRLPDVTAIFTEVWFLKGYAGQPRFWRFWWYLRRRGFLLHGFPYFSGYWADAVFINREGLGRKRRWRLQAREVGALCRSVLPVLGVGRYRDRLRQLRDRLRQSRQGS